jgi:hypothetical protein
MLLRQGAWIHAADGRFAFIDEHANWAKRSGNLAGIGLPTSVWETIRDIPNDYGGPNREAILRTVMAAGGIRMRGHGDVVVFEFTCDSKVALPACRDVLRQVAGEFTRCRFNNLSTNETVEVIYDNYVTENADASSFHWQTP